MARLLKESDIKPALKLATSSTKELVIAGVNGDEDFPELLAKYTWTGTRDYNMALIIVALYTYCMKQRNSDLKKFGVSVRQKGSNSSKLFEYLREGNGKKVKDCMGLYFKRAVSTILEKSKLTFSQRSKIIKSFINQAGKITKWKYNQNDINNILNCLIPTMSIKYALLSAIESGSLEDLKQLIENNNILDLNNIVINNYFDYLYDGTLLSIAVKKNNYEIVKFLLGKGADPNIKCVKDGYPPLYVAMSPGNTKIIKLLLDNGADPNIKSGHFKETPLHSSMRCFFTDKTNTLKIIKLLLDNGADINSQDKRGWTPLCVAAVHCRVEIVNFLLENGADPNLSCPMEVARHYMDYKYFKKIEQILIDAGANTNYPYFDGSVNREVFDAVCRNHSAIFDATPRDALDILRLGFIKPNIKNWRGKTLLYYAMDNTKDYTGDRHDLVHYLLEYGDDPNVKGKQGQSPLHFAIGSHDEKLMKLLLNKGADTTIQNREGKTPLHVAAESGQINMVKLLLQNGVDPNIKSKDNKTPLFYAIHASNTKFHATQDTNFLATIQVLFDYGANFEPNDYSVDAVLINELLAKVKLKRPYQKSGK